jgi:hypothetical protein
VVFAWRHNHKYNDEGRSRYFECYIERYISPTWMELNKPKEKMGKNPSTTGLPCESLKSNDDWRSATKQRKEEIGGAKEPGRKN